MKLKNIIAQLKSSIESFIEGVIKQKKALRKLENRPFEIFWSKEEEEQQQKKMRGKNLNALWNPSCELILYMHYESPIKNSLQYSCLESSMDRGA